MKTLPELLAMLWGPQRAGPVAAEYKIICTNHPLFVRDMAAFCNAASPIQGTNEYERGIEEGKRRVWLHIARLAALKPIDFISITDKEETND